MKKRYWIAIILIVIVIIISFVWIIGFYPRYGREIGDFSIVNAVTVFNESTYVNGVEITLEDMTSGQPTQTDITKTIIYSEEYPEDKNDGIANFTVILGNTYKITVSFHDSTNSTICTFGSATDEEGHHWFIGGIHIKILEENTIGPIICHHVGLL